MMPVLGFGTYMVPPAETEQAVLLALITGYRLIDTAVLYGNEKEVGSAIRKSGIPRNEIFVTTKLYPLQILDVESSFKASLERLGMDTVDLYLIHWPFFRKQSVWKAFEKILDSGRARAIGVSNYTIRDLEYLLQDSKIVPAVNQVEFHPFLIRKKLRDFCASKGITFEAHSPLTHGHRINDPALLPFAKKYGKTPAQIMIRWGLQHGAIVIPKTVHSDRMKENLEVFDFALSDEDMAKIDGLNEGYRVSGITRLVGE